jgi:hypothetical protein
LPGIGRQAACVKDQGRIKGQGKELLGAHAGDCLR